jgi:hypothetical protein
VPGAHVPPVFIIDTPKTKGAIGFLKFAKPIQIAGVTIDCRNDYAVVLVTSLDDQPIAESKRVLVTAMTDDRPYGFRAQGGVIRSLGQFPFTVADIDATVILPGEGWKATVLDENGYPRGEGGNPLPRDAVYTLFERN